MRLDERLIAVASRLDLIEKHLREDHADLRARLSAVEVELDKVRHEVISAKGKAQGAVVVVRSGWAVLAAVLAAASAIVAALV